MDQALRILIADDSEADSQLLLRALRSGGIDPEYERVDTAVGLRAALDKGLWDIVLCDYSMSQFDALDALELVRRKDADLPVIIISGTIGEDVAVAAMRAGASDYFMKGNLVRLIPAIERELRDAQERRALKDAQQEVLRLASFPTLNPNPISEADLTGRIQYLNPAAQALFPDLAQRQADHAWMRDWFLAAQASIKAGAQGLRRALTVRGRWYQQNIHYLEELQRFRIYSLDITDLKLAEEALQASEQEFRILAEAMPQIVWMTRPDGWNIYFNQKWMEYTGLTLEESLGHGWIEPFHPDDQKRAWNAWQKATTENAEYALECRLRRADGTYRWWLVRGVPRRDASGKILKWYGTCTDIHDLKTAELRLAEAHLVLGLSERRFRTLFDSSHDAIALLEPPGWKFTSCNAAMVKMMGAADAASLIGLGPQYLSAERQPSGEPSEAGIGKKIESALRAGQNIFEWKFRRLSGEEFPAILVVTRMEYDGKIVLHAAIRDLADVKRGEQELKRLKTAIEHASEGVVITDLSGTMLYVNPAVEKASGYRREELLGQNSRIFKSGKHDEGFYRDLWKTILSGRPWTGRIVNKRKDGSLVNKEMTISPVYDDAGRVINYVAVKRDVSEQVRLESELRQSQKMESIGRLAGGVAHDFNNILTAINGYTGFVLAGLSEGDSRRADLNEVLAAGERATRLTRQLLAFSRKQILNPEILDLNAVVGGIVNMLKRLIGEDIKLVTRFASQSCLAKVDAGQIEQVFLNLAVNARDAMPKGGTLTFETTIATATEDFLLRHPDMPRGPLVCLIVRDTGCGMTDEVKAHLFEPFFTTKQKDMGTGLGLATVFGIIKQSGGSVEVESAPERGTTFRIYLPQTEAQAQYKDKDKDKVVIPRGNETVLYVEDEDSLRRLGERVLTGNGYTVLVAANGKDALKVLERHGTPVDLLITDVVMPGMSGRELAQAIASKNMAHRTLFLSGFTDDAVVVHGILEPGLAFMHKPFSPSTLLLKTREVLDGPADQAKA